MTEANSTPRLTVELVPSTSHFQNLRSLLSQSDWNRLRRQTYRKAGYRCEICGGRGPRHPVECHEIWDYDDARFIQTLTGLIALCPACHQVKHIGLAAIRGKLPQAVGHLARVNDWDADTCQWYIQRAFNEHRRRSQFAWTLDVSILSRL